MKRYLFILFLAACFFKSYKVLAQQKKIISATGITDSHYPVLKNSPEDTAKVNALNKLAKQLINTGSYPKADSLIVCAMQLANKLNYKKGQAEASKNRGVINWKQGRYRNALEDYFEALKIYQDIADKPGIASVYNDIGIVYNEQGDTPDAIKNYLAALKIDEEIGNKSGMGNAYGNIGMMYFEQSSYSEALENMLRGLKIDEEIGNKKAMTNAYGNIGGIYSARGNYIEALKYEWESLKIAQDIDDKRGIGATYEDIGVIYQDQGDYAEALKRHTQALKMMKELGDNYGIGIIYENMGSICLKQKKYGEAKKYIDTALALSKDMGNKIMIRDSYSCQFLLDSGTGDYKAAYNDYKRYSMYKDSIINEENTKKIISAQMNYDFDKKMAAGKAEQEKAEIIKTAESKRKSIIAYGAIIISVISIISAILLIGGQLAKRKKDKIIFERETTILKIEKQQAESELSNARQALEEYTMNMVEKTKLLEQFQADIESLKQDADKVKIEQLEHLNKATILTKDDWDKFKALFEQVHKGYFDRLKQRMPDLSHAEIRLVCLTKLELDTKQMASVLGVSYNTIVQTRYNLRKKLGLPKEDNIDDIAQSI